MKKASTSVSCKPQDPCFSGYHWVLPTCSKLGSTVLRYGADTIFTLGMPLRFDYPSQSGSSNALQLLIPVTVSFLWCLGWWGSFMPAVSTGLCSPMSCY